MKKLTDQELDSLFKAAAEGLQPAFDSAGWEAMETKLDQAHRAPWRGWIPLTLLGVIIFSGGVWVGITYEVSSIGKVVPENKGQALMQDQPVTARQNQSQLQSASEPEQERNIADKRSGQENKSGESVAPFDPQVIRNEKNNAHRSNSVVTNKKSQIGEAETFVSQNENSGSLAAAHIEQANEPSDKQGIRDKKNNFHPSNGVITDAENNISEAEPLARQNENSNSLMVPEHTEKSDKPVIGNQEQVVHPGNSVIDDAENHISGAEPPDLQNDKRSSLTVVNGDHANDSIMHEMNSGKAAINQSETAETVIEQRNKGSNSIFIRALASPDLSSINYAAASSVGSNFALLVEYQFNHRWSVSTGGIWSKKKYSTDSEITYGNYKADRLDGTCSILDIPINLSYQFRPHHRTSFYASVGFSSYIMVSENYTYTVYTSYGDRVYNDEVDGKNNEWFKMLNLSLGIQHQLSHRLYLQAEPFLKAPLAGVGEGDVFLSSMGIFVGLKYRIK